MTERILTQVQAPKLGFLRRVHGVTKGRTDIRLRPGQKTSLAPPYMNLSYFGIKFPALTIKRATLLRLFGGDSASRSLCPLVTLLVWHFGTKCTAVKFAVPWMSNHFS